MVGFTYLILSRALVGGIPTKAAGHQFFPFCKGLNPKTSKNSPNLLVCWFQLLLSTTYQSKKVGSYVVERRYYKEVGFFSIWNQQTSRPIYYALNTRSTAIYGMPKTSRWKLRLTQFPQHENKLMRHNLQFLARLWVIQSQHHADGCLIMNK